MYQLPGHPGITALSVRYAQGAVTCSAWASVCMAAWCRRHVSKLLILDGREKLEMWWVEEGYLTDLSSVLLVRSCLDLPWHAC